MANAKLTKAQLLAELEYARVELNRLRTENEALRKDVQAAQPAYRNPNTGETSRQRALRIAKELALKGHKVVVRGDEVTDYGRRTH